MVPTPVLALSIFLLGAAVGALLVSLRRAGYETRLLAKLQRQTMIDNGYSSPPALPNQCTVVSGSIPRSPRHRPPRWRKTYVVF
jgi:hypothetical protein